MSQKEVKFAISVGNRLQVVLDHCDLVEEEIDSFGFTAFDEPRCSTIAEDIKEQVFKCQERLQRIRNNLFAEFSSELLRELNQRETSNDE